MIPLGIALCLFATAAIGYYIDKTTKDKDTK